ncbi:alpha-ketoglutarate-dependent dioxygenase AlkB family protein [Vibrio ostreicida]|uniref:alpha-ketoglutarate-dependent dioxygenase AlkB family protein n=1 Tax=Vibrio ostreicida TaxID=526588 RepID=UPI0009712282|nr:alpha-ketoglutarate-dependent dioxygenase AlkB [Vibrio ostreicida]
MDLFGALNYPWLTLTNGKILWVEHFIDKEEADVLQATLRETVPWSQEKITLFGRSVSQPRLQAWYGDKAYTYSGLTLTPTPLPPSLEALKSRCEISAQQNFNSVFLNLYRDGQDSMGAHQDNEPELGPNPTIASLSLGSTRRFVLKHTQTAQRHVLELTHGSLLVMSGELQHYWKHSVPKTTKPVGERINLTFRCLL